MLKIWGRATSSNVQAVMWAVGELGLEHERLDVGGAYGGTDTPEYGAMNPNRLVPTLQDGDLTMWESAACVRYLAARYGDGNFWPRDPAARARVDMWAEWAKVSFMPPFIEGVFIPLIRVHDADRDLAALAKAEKRVAGVARIAEARLAETPWIGGEHFSFADIIFGTPLYRYFTLPFGRVEAPNLEAYYARLTERPSYARHAMVSYDSLRVK